MKKIAVILLIAGAGLLLYSFSFIGDERAADVGPIEINDEPYGKWQPLTGTVLLIAGIVTFYMAARKR